jgi:hypothetical protein
MAKLTAKARSKIPSGKFAGPGRSYPIEDDNHARAALSMAPRGVKAGNISAKTAASIEAKAKAKLARDKAGAAEVDDYMAKTYPGR